MRSDLDSLMRMRDTAGMVVFAFDRYTPAMFYAAGQKIHVGMYVRAADGRAHLAHDPMERDQAAKVGCPLSTYAQHGVPQRIEKHRDSVRAYADLAAELLASLGIRGKVAFFGDLPAGMGYQFVSAVREFAPDVTPDLAQPDLLTLARATKDADEIAAIRHASRGVTRAYARLREYLAGLRRDGETFRDGGEAVTLGRLRSLLHTEFLEHGLEGGESIVSQGRDAGVPHNRGNDAEPLKAGAPVIVDIFPGEAGGGYYSDFTRTFCMGKASPELRRIYDDVNGAFRQAMDTLKVGESCRDYQERTCAFFEARGHATLRTNQTTQEGYCHGLGHGVGLAVHEAPRLGGPPSNTQKLEPGMVVTVEPGLYYPSKGMGARIEDLVVMTPDGRYENLTPAPYDLEIESHA
ncbi:MAG: M24 family metallopeptidase [Candidatus Eisenbacteria bacterium]